MKKKTGALAWVAKRVKPFVPLLILLILIATVISYINVQFALVSRTLIDVATKKVEGSVLDSALKLVFLLVGQLVLQVLYIRMHITVSGKLTMAIRTELYYKLLKKDYISVSGMHSGEVLSRLISDVSLVSEQTTSIIPNIVSLLSTVLFSFIALYQLDKYFALACLAVGPIVMLAAYIYKKKIKTLHLQCRESDGKMRSFLQETIQNFLVVKAFGRETVMRENSKGLQYENFKLHVKRSTVGILANVMFFLAVTAGYYIALGWSVYRLSLDLITFGTVTAVLGLVSQLQTPFRDLASVLPQIYMVSASAQRLIDLDNLPEEQKSLAEKSISELCDFSEICFSNISFSYGDVPVLNNVNLTIEKGDFIAICGPSGGGKSTLTRMLLSVLSPNSGRAYLKLESGEEISFSNETRSLFSYVPQGNLILSGTIRENIAFSEKEPDDEKVMRALELAQLTEVINGLPNGLDTVLGEKGHGLSEGQIQRVALARAFYYDAPVLLLDEATSSLDLETESSLLNHIRKLTDKTCIIVSHRKEVIDACDKTYYLQDGTLQVL